MNNSRSNWFREWSAAVLERDEPPTGSPQAGRRPIESPLIPGWMAMLPVFCTAAWLMLLLTAIAVL